jgi:hypothetical protein
LLDWRPARDFDAFDESSRPVATVDFENPIEAEERDALIAEAREQAVHAIRNHLQHEYQWAAQGRTLRARMIRLALLKGDQNIHDLAARFKVSEHDVGKYRRELLKLRRRLFVETNESKSGVFWKASRNLEVRRLSWSFFMRHGENQKTRAQ